MWSLNKDAVLTGQFDSFCLPCESSLTQETVEGHISTSVHKEKLNATSYAPKYEHERVRKVKNGYYCEFCNVLLATAAKVGLHVSQGDHAKSKGYKLLKHVDSGVIAYEEVLIDDKSWHGLADETCCICDTEVTNDDDHKKQSSHILKLIQSDVEFKNSETIYRKVDSKTLQCLICNSVFDIKHISSHFETPDHKKNFQTCCENKRKLSDKRSSQTSKRKERNSNEKANEITNPSNDDKETNSKKEASQQFANTEKSKKLAEKNENETIHPFEAIEEAKKLAKKNKIKYTLGKQSAYCSACDVTISSSIKRIKEHISEAGHNEK